MDHRTEQVAASHAPELRRRARHLTDLACRIERSLVLTLAETADWDVSVPRIRLCDELLRCNLHQLHRAADDLRVTALRFRERADELETATHSAA